MADNCHDCGLVVIDGSNCGHCRRALHPECGRTRHTMQGTMVLCAACVEDYDTDDSDLRADDNRARRIDINLEL